MLLFGRLLNLVVRPMLRDYCPVCLSVTLVYCDQTVGWIKMPLGVEVGLGSGNIMLDMDQALPPRERGTARHFSAYVTCGQVVAHLSYCLIYGI